MWFSPRVTKCQGICYLSQEVRMPPMPHIASQMDINDPTTIYFFEQGASCMEINFPKTTTLSFKRKHKQPN